MKNKIIDLTPLLDVVLIMVFALLITVANNEEESRVKANELEGQVKSLAEENQTIINENNQLALENDQLKYLEEIREELEDATKLEYLSQYFFFIDIHVDVENNHEIIINDTKTNIYVSFDQLSDVEVKKQKEEQLSTYLIKLVESEGNMNHVLISVNDYGYVQRVSFNFIKNVSSSIKNDFDFSVYVNENLYYKGE
jgi:biopolymer transport protein ExbD